MTSLAFDFAERYPTAVIPQLRRPIQAITSFSKDWMLLARAPDKSDCHWRACEIQNAYATAVRKMLEESTRVPEEAWRIVEQWQVILNQLETADDKSEPPRVLVGRVDWITKLWILDQLNKEQATVDAKRKLDLRYHELSNQGYYRRVLNLVDIPRVISRRGTERARCNPPTEDPISVARSYLIREFSDESSALTMDRDKAQWIANGKVKTVWFS
jgi:proteasome accessory factor A